MRDNELKQIDQNIKESKLIVKMAEALENLGNSRDFKLVIMEGYFKEEAIRLVMLRSDPSMQTPERQQSLMAQIDAIGTLNQYFQTVFFKGSIANKAIAADEETREEILLEEQGGAA